MNKQQRLKSLTWKYFWQQKWDEIKPFFLIILGFTALWTIPEAMGLILLSQFPNIFSINNNLSYGINAWTRGFTFLGALILFCLVIGSIIYWIKSNWQKAKERAQKEI